MSKELEALEHFIRTSVWNEDEFHKIWDNGNSDLEIIKQALQRLESIDNANPSEALNITKATEKYTGIDLTTIKQALQRLNKYEQILGKGRLTDRNYKNTTLDLDSCKPYLRLGQLEDIYEEGK